MKIQPPPFIFAPGADAYLVGGSVRDLLIGRQPTDFDLVVPGSASSYAQRLAESIGKRAITIGKAPDCVYRVINPPVVVDIADMKGGDLVADLNRRDFTINALAFDPADQNIIDISGGLADIGRRRIRMLSEQALLDDPLRMIRAYRMAAVLDFEIEPATRQSIARHAPLIAEPAAERVWFELQFILSSAASCRQLGSMAHDGLLWAILPELKALKRLLQNRHHTMDVLDHTMTAYQVLENRILGDPHACLPTVAARFVEQMASEKRLLMKLAVLLHDIGKPASCTSAANGENHFYGHARRSADLTRRLTRRLRMPRRHADWVESLICAHQRPLSLYLARQDQNTDFPLAAGRFFRRNAQIIPYLLLHAMADTWAKGPDGPHQDSIIVFLKEMLTEYFTRIHSHRSDKPLINGQDIIEQFGLAPSPSIGKLLKQVEEARLAGIIHNRRQALHWAARALARRLD